MIPLPDKTNSLARKSTDWPLFLRFAVLVIPVGIALALVAAWAGYRAATVPLKESLELLPLLKATAHAERMSETLAQLRRSLNLIAQSDEINAQSIRRDFPIFFHENAHLIREIGFQSTDGDGFMLSRDAQGLREISQAEASLGPYSPLQQIKSHTLKPGHAVLFPVSYDDPGTGRSGECVPVLRMILLLPDSSGTLVMGISIADWQRGLAALLQSDTAMRTAAQRSENAVQLAFFFDTQGWILFEMDETGSRSYPPDLSRQGYAGDLGRAGYGAAFRPWATHEYYWRMVMEVEAGRTGSVPAPADKYRTVHAGSTGFLCFAPVFFSQTEGGVAAPLGGVAFFETSLLPLNAFLHLISYSVALILASLAVFSFLALRVNGKLAVPFRRMAEELDVMERDKELRLLNGTPQCAEQKKLQAAVNVVISNAMNARNDLTRLTKEVRHARARLPVDLWQPLDTPLPEDAFGLVGSSRLIQEVREQVSKAARAGTDVLIFGETGTGKELVAAAIHKASPRAAGPYVSINCGALDENLLLDALFGHVKGAFTEARTDRKGAFLAADGGTLHLDEIANASPKVQQALLRALSVRHIRPLGTDSEIPFRTSVVAATNVDLRECVRAGTFREDLYYRLAIISIETPPLRRRKEDIPELAAFCIHEAAATLGRNKAELSRGALELMSAYDWPGNVRELKNRIIRAMAFVEDDNLILQQHICLEPNVGKAGEALCPDEQDFKRSVASAGTEELVESPFPDMENLAFSGQGSPSELLLDKNGSPPVGLESGLRLNERQIRTLEIFRATGTITRSEYERIAGQNVSVRTAQNDLRKLVRLGLIKRVSAGPGTRYQSVSNTPPQ